MVRLSRRWNALLRGMGLGSIALLACAPEPFVHDDLEGRISSTDALWYLEGTSALNVLFIVDNSAQMENYQEIVALQVGRLLRDLLGDFCMALEGHAWKRTEEQPDAWGYCQGGDGWVHAPRFDLRVGVLSTSLGGPGCSNSAPENDGARFMGQVRAGLTSHHPAGFLLWERDTPQEHVGDFLRDVEAHVRAAGVDGCQYPAPLEVASRFLTTGERGVDASDWEGTQLKLQRSAFLRDGVPLIIVGVLAQDDCSLPADLDWRSVNPDLLSRSADQSSCERLVEAFPSDPRIPKENYIGLRWGSFVRSSRDECSDRGCAISSDGPYWAVPWALLPASSDEPQLRIRSSAYESGYIHALEGATGSFPGIEELSFSLHGIPSTFELCLSRPLLLDDQAGVGCRMAQVQGGQYDSAPDCSAPGLRPADDRLRALATRKLRASELCDQPGKLPCDEFAMCEVEQLTGDDREACLADQPTVSGFCYVDSLTLPRFCWRSPVLRVVSPPASPLFESRIAMLWCQQEH